MLGGKKKIGSHWSRFQHVDERDNFRLIGLFFCLDYETENQAFLLTLQIAHWSPNFSFGDGIYMEGFWYI